MDMLIAIGLLLILSVILTIIWWRGRKETEMLQDRMMAKYVERHSEIGKMGWVVSAAESGDVEKEKVIPPPDIRVSNAATGNNPIVDTKHKKAEILIPQNLSEEEKQIVKDFYNL